LSVKVGWVKCNQCEGLAKSRGTQGPILQATILVAGGDNDQLIPLCDEHENEYARMFGEDMTDQFSIIGGEIDLEELIEWVNGKLTYWDKRYTKLLGEYIASQHTASIAKVREAVEGKRDVLKKATPRDVPSSYSLAGQIAALESVLDMPVLARHAAAAAAAQEKERAVDEIEAAEQEAQKDVNYWLSKDDKERANLAFRYRDGLRKALEILRRAK
jgi:hypothetical protein